MLLTPLQKLPKNVKDLGKLIVVKGFKKLPKVKKSPNLVTLMASDCDTVGRAVATDTGYSSQWQILFTGN